VAYTGGVNLSDRPEPAVVPQVITFVTMVLGLAATFGLPLDEDQQRAILECLAAGLGLLAVGGAYWTRRRVTPLADPVDEDGDPLVAIVPDPGGRHLAPE